MAALSTALIEHKRITTTLPKAKALRSFVEPLINRAKEDTTHNRRQVFRRLQSKEAVKSLFGEVADVLGDRPGGYTRVVKLGQRAGDAAEMAIIELVDFNDVKPGSTDSGKKKTRRSRSKISAVPAASTPTVAETDDAATVDDLTRLWGIGDVFASALQNEGITTFAELAGADLEALRTAINAGSDTTDEAANEETWSEQARFAVAGDWDGLDAYIEMLKGEGGTAHTPPENIPEAKVSTDDMVAEAAPETVEPEGDAPDAIAEIAPEEQVPTDEVAIENPSAPEVAPEGTLHPDAEQGAPPGDGTPPPEANPEIRGKSGHRE